MRHRPLLLVPILAALAIATPARAQSAAEDRAAADALYEEAGNLMKAGRFVEACPKLEASQKLDPGIGTTLRLGYCYEHAGRTASAWSAYNDAEGMARKAGDKRADEAGKRAKQVEPLLSRLVLDVAPENRSGGTEIRRDGRAIDPAAWTSAIPVDPGTHTIEASGAGRLPWKTTITIDAKAGTQTVQVPALAIAPEAPRTEAAAPFWGPLRIAGVAVGSVGLIGVVVGAVFGARTMAKASESNAHCSGSPALCDPTGLSLRSDAKALAKVADVGLIVGGAAAAAGVVVFLTAPAAKPAAAGRVRFEFVPVPANLGAGARILGAW
jgi:serine/threonine-protein kinase